MPSYRRLLLRDSWNRIVWGSLAIYWTIQLVPSLARLLRAVELASAPPWVDALVTIGFTVVAITRATWLRYALRDGIRTQARVIGIDFISRFVPYSRDILYSYEFAGRRHEGRTTFPSVDIPTVNSTIDVYVSRRNPRWSWPVDTVGGL